ncbi:hypothetical protein [Hymenobacter yonginensis]|uniref:Uncharacterized protein n=1 Tax=Hymenobacter yonginensis TaxID=748197 RepID=A0ABY7PTX0_9BACT|nr:hypothetical protein [Hymenobacter yonginensis]WBO86371.1 hypothetical protein O9Z63_08930 [Hymenobacter yonginensis]
MQSLPQLIQNSLPYFVPEDATEDSVHTNLLADNIPDALATQLVLFIPLAFGRAFLRKFPLEFPPTFTLQYSNGEVVKDLLFADEPVYLAAARVAEDIIGKGAWSETFHFEVAAWSPEVDACSQALAEGFKPETISLSALYIFGDIGPRPAQAD